MSARRKLGENDPGRYEIHVLVGPCLEAEADEAADAILQALRGSNLGAAVSITTFDETEDAA